ncbi:MAG TPA: hypothetical protein DCS93_42855 [Microscillaceae bacterium]|nr:hypothetical protein [Microscillaceae bacterium]
MKKIRYALLACFVIGFQCIQAQKLFTLKENYDFNSNSLLVGIDATQENVGEWKVYQKTNTLSSATATISLDVFNGQSITFDSTSVVSDDDGSFTWLGASQSPNYPNATIYLKLDNGVYHGVLELDGNNKFGISFIGDNHYVFYKAEELQPNCDTPIYSDKIESDNTIVPPIINPALLGPCNGLYTYRLVIAYTPEFAATFTGENQQGQINDFLVGVADNVNQVYINSGLNVRARLAFSYLIADSEFGNKDQDFSHFVSGSHFTRFSSIWGIKDFYRADATILLTSTNYGGRASERKNMGLYGKNGAAGTHFGVAHEIGHMFGLDHNREEYSWWVRKINGFGWAKDNKKAYGFRDHQHRTVMAYNDHNLQARVGIHADQGLTFPSGNPAGDNYARARNFLAGHLGNVIDHFDHLNLRLNDQVIGTTEMASWYAIEDIETSNYVVTGPARVNLRAAQQVVLKPGTNFMNGSEVNIAITPCAQAGFRTTNSTVSNNKKSDIVKKQSIDTQLKQTIKVFPNPLAGKLNLEVSTKELQSKIDVTIYSSLGQLVYASTYTNVKSFKDVINLSSLPNGIYFLNVKTENEFQVKRLLINK